jgi:adenine-specific DNA-methyltransferase
MAIKYIPYYPNTVEGQAVLDNITRTRRVLRYRDNGKVIERIKRGIPLYEVAELEQVGDKNENLLIRGECLTACAYLKERGIKLDLVYIDPPFASGADYAKKVYLRRNPKQAAELAKLEEQAQGGEEIALDELKAFEEKMYGDIWNKEDYLNWMFENLHAIKSVMSDTSAIYVHLDWHISHYVKILMDEVFGEDNFRNEIVWCYKTSLRSSSKSFGRDHDIIYFYSLNESHEIHPDKSDFPSSESTIKRWGEYADETGFVSNKHFAGSKSTIINTDDETKGFNIYNGIPRDWWEISANVSKGNTDEVISGKYATQKPESLLERIIKASSNEEMIVADFFGGSGVTANVANRLGRKFIHADVGVNSIQTARDRLVQSETSFTVLDIQDGVSLFRNPVQTMDKLKMLITGLKNEDGLDEFWEGALQDSKLGLLPVYVPNLLDHATKVLDVPLVNRVLQEAIPELPDDIKRVIVYYVDIDDEKAVNVFLKENNMTGVEVELRDLKEVLDDIVINDEITYQVKKSKEGFTVEITHFISDRLTQKIEEYNRKRKLGKRTLLDDTDEDAEPEAKAKGQFKPIVVSDDGLELIEFVSLDCHNANESDAWHSDEEIKIDKKGFVIRNGEKTRELWDGTIHSKKKPLRLKVRNIAGDESIINL